MDVWRTTTVLLLAAGLSLSGCGAHVWHVVQKNETLYSISFRYGEDYRDVARWNGIEPPYALRVGEPLRIVPPARGDARRTTGDVPVVTAAASPVLIPVPASEARAPAVETYPLSPETRASAVETHPLSPETRAPAAETRAPAAVTSAPAPSAARAAPAATPSASTGRPAAAASSTAGANAGPFNWSWPVSRADASVKPARKGLDITAPRGEPVRAAAPGRVVYSGSGIPHYGNLLIIKHNDQFLSAYAHNERLLVSQGQDVAAGQQIAEMGDSGAGADTVKLHFEIRLDGTPVDPMRYLPKR